jgi:hypothetical protein
MEIGVFEGESLTLALPGTRAIGIDPGHQLAHQVTATARLYRETSDDFFVKHNVRKVLGGLPVDLAFIDGMHLFEFALRDFMNIEALTSENSTVMVHDCLPIDETTAARDRTTNKWSGDIWKLILCLKEYRPDLRISVVDVRPTGLAMIRGLDATSTVLADRYEEICAKYVPMPFSVLDADRDRMLNVFPDDWPQIRSLLPAEPFRSESSSASAPGRRGAAALSKRVMRRLARVGR